LVWFGVVVAPAGAAPIHTQSNPGGFVVGVSPPTVSPGETVQILGYDFPPSIDVTGQICGDDNLSGSQDCVLDNIGFGSTDSHGSFTISLTVAVPPVPCPCVATVSSQQLSSTPSSPLTIIGAPVTPLRPPTSAATVKEPLQIVNAQLSGNGPWYSWFGGTPRRTLNLTVHNPNQGVYPHPSLALAAGRSGGGLSTVSTSSLPSMAPGETTTVHVNVVFPALTIGDAQVVGTVGDAALMKRIQVTTTIVPWGLIVIALVILQLILLAIRNALRRRKQRREADAPPALDEDFATPPPDVDGNGHGNGKGVVVTPSGEDALETAGAGGPLLMQFKSSREGTG
jgi:hypothetical protein